MGIRFRCHHCQFELHVKDFQGGKRGRCPECSGKFRIPPSDSEFSLPIDDLASTSVSGEASDQELLSSAILAIESSVALTPTTELKTAAVQSVPAVREQISNPSTETSHSTENSAGAITLAAFRESPKSMWHVRPPSGGQYGPANCDTFFQWMVENRVTIDSLVWREGWPEWLVAEHVFNDHFQSSTGNSKVVTSGIKPAKSAAAPSVAARQLKKKRAEKRYSVMVGALAVVAVLLVIALVVVLVVMPTGTSQPTQ